MEKAKERPKRRARKREEEGKEKRKEKKRERKRKELLSRNPSEAARRDVNAEISWLVMDG